ncbi:MAG: UDP-3-O-(3-hydroxymyristoyl)glucosamine N-acyltransferase, partial [Planctomycetota bacterium]
MSAGESGTFRLDHLAELVGGRVDGDASVEVAGIEGLRHAAPGQLSFLADPQYTHQVPETDAVALLVPADFEPPAGCDLSLIRVDHIAAALTRLGELFAPPPPPRCDGVHPTAFVGDEVALGAGVSVGPSAVIEARARIGDDATIGPGAFVGYEAAVGAGTSLAAGVKLCHRCRVGDRCILHPGVVIGGDGFGFYFDDGAHRKIPQIGTVEVGDDVEIGSNTTIDRARFGVTRVGSGTKIDNLVMIAHNVQIGEHCIITGQCGIAGSATIGNYVMIGAQTGVLG